MKLRGINPEDLEQTVWRYMSFPKFISLLTYQALWFSKLNILQDTYEGMIPAKTKAQMREQNQRFKEVFNTPEFHRQIDTWPTQNENDGRELLVVTCWFLSENDSIRMWQDYGASDEAVAIKSTIGRLSQHIFVPRDETISHLGRVDYVEHDVHEMNAHAAQQAIERAFIKDKSLSHEKEIRLVTHSVKTTHCVSPEGKPYTPDQVTGANMNNFENPGLYVMANLNQLITEIVVCPSAQDWFVKLVTRIAELSGISARVLRSKAQNAA